MALSAQRAPSAKQGITIRGESRNICESHAKLNSRVVEDPQEAGEILARSILEDVWVAVVGAFGEVPRGRCLRQTFTEVGRFPCEEVSVNAEQEVPDLNRDIGRVSRCMRLVSEYATYAKDDVSARNVVLVVPKHLLGPNGRRANKSSVHVQLECDARM